MEVVKLRILWVDFLRIIAAFVLVVQHGSQQGVSFAVPRDTLVLCLWDHSIVPLFFLFSGYFVRSNRELFAWRRCIFLLIPYVIWCIVAALVFHWKSGLFGYLGFWGCALGVKNLQPFNCPLWFLAELMPLALVSPILSRFKTMFLIIAVLCIFFLCEEQISGLSSVHVSGVGFYLLGMVLGRETWVFEKVRSYAPLIFCILFVFGLAEAFREPFRESYQRGTAGMICGCLFYVSMAFVVEKYAAPFFVLLARFGKYACFVYATHFIVIKVVGQRICRIESEPWVSAFCTIFPFALVAAQILVCRAGERWVPHLMPYLALVKPSKGS